MSEGAVLIALAAIIRAALAPPIHVPRRGVRLSRRDCDAGFAESIEDGDPQICARATTFASGIPRLRPSPNMSPVPPMERAPGTGRNPASRSKPAFLPL